MYLSGLYIIYIYVYIYIYDKHILRISLCGHFSSSFSSTLVGASSWSAKAAVQRSVVEVLPVLDLQSGAEEPNPREFLGAPGSLFKRGSGAISGLIKIHWEHVELWGFFLEAP